MRIRARHFVQSRKRTHKDIQPHSIQRLLSPTRQVLAPCHTKVDPDRHNRRHNPPPKQREALARNPLHVRPLPGTLPHLDAQELELVPGVSDEEVLQEERAKGAAGVRGAKKRGDGVPAEGGPAPGEGVDIEVSAALAEVHFGRYGARCPAYLPQRVRGVSGLGVERESGREIVVRGSDGMVRQATWRQGIRLDPPASSQTPKTRRDAASGVVALWALRVYRGAPNAATDTAPSAWRQGG